MMLLKPACCLFISISLGAGVVLAAQDNDKASQHPKKATKTEQGVKARTTEPKSTPTIKPPALSEKEFLKQAATGGMFEIQVAQLAEQNASSDKVKAFAKRMITDHSKNDDLLKGVAQTQHVALPTELDPKHKSEKEALEKKKGSEFDKQYMALMVSDHQQTVDKFKHEASSAADPTVKHYAEASLPTLESHLNDAKTTQSQLGAPEKK